MYIDFPLELITSVSEDRLKDQVKSSEILILVTNMKVAETRIIYLSLNAGLVALWC